MIPQTTARWPLARLLAAALLSASLATAHAGDADANLPAALQARHDALQARLRHNQYQRPIHLDSSESPGSVTGDIYALVNHPYAAVGAALTSPEHWCDILILHLNTKYCRATTTGQGTVLNVSIGKKHAQPLHEAYRVTFAYGVAAHAPSHLQVRLNADEGPLGTRDYRIVLAAIPLRNGQTFIRLSYSYAYGLAGRLAMQSYLGTIGRSKVGFTVVGKESDGRPVHISGMRGLVERNTMRYYLAIEAFLAALSDPPQTQLEKRLQGWFAAIERYPLQLHELERSEYLDMKRKEYLRQQVSATIEYAPARSPA